ncbi:hypothetical protein C0J50_23424 [Silurus asotus]|uniref:Uncharacterized protein n=1 Tax=Silurus asotus TaxID=30991 RepID=A0AAD5FHM2_SILAS|nr:hypothetical protein C0J50_23424 [Silurus asotus]
MRGVEASGCTQKTHFFLIRGRQIMFIPLLTAPVLLVTRKQWLHRRSIGIRRPMRSQGQGVGEKGVWKGESGRGSLERGVWKGEGTKELSGNEESGRVESGRSRRPRGKSANGESGKQKAGRRSLESRRQGGGVWKVEGREEESGKQTAGGGVWKAAFLD